MFRITSQGFVVALLLALTPPLSATAIFNSGIPDGRLGTASRPDIPAGSEIESADDFLLTSSFFVNHATFTGLLTGSAPTIGTVTVEIYRVFPLDSTSPPDGRVPTRTNSPSDNAFDSRSTATANLSFSTSNLGAFSAANSILTGIHPSPNQTTGGEGPINGNEVVFTVNFTTPFQLPADHYFFVPQVQVTNGTFYWLSTARPITGAGTTPFASDLQSWVRNSALDPDWLRAGTDVLGAGTFNAAFTLDGTQIPEPSSGALLLGGSLAIAFGVFRKR
jgi:PEP-CTERM putative exosortase interaction domain